MGFYDVWQPVSEYVRDHGIIDWVIKDDGQQANGKQAKIFIGRTEYGEIESNRAFSAAYGDFCIRYPSRNDFDDKWKHPYEALLWALSTVENFTPTTPIMRFEDGFYKSGRRRYRFCCSSATETLSWAGMVLDGGRERVLLSTFNITQRAQ